MGRTITISGHSDDTVNVEGNGSGIDELRVKHLTDVGGDSYAYVTAVIMAEGGRAARVTMRYKGVWTAEVGQLDEDVPLATITVREAHPYSVSVTVESVISIVQEA